jgi:porphobilinogen deaminase
MSKITIALSDLPGYKRYWDFINPVLKEFSFEKKPLAVSASFSALGQVLQNKEADTFLFPLEMIPIQRPEELVVTALLKRYQPGWTLLVHQDFHDAGKILQVPNGGSIMCTSPVISEWMKNIRSDISYKVLPDPTFFFTGEMLEKSKAWILPSYLVEANQEDLKYWLQREILPEELPGLPGQGALAVVCRKEDIFIRRKFNGLHLRELVPVCNVERRILKEVAQPENKALLVYCKHEESKPFELFLKIKSEEMGVVTKHISSATHLNLVKEAGRDA